MLWVIDGDFDFEVREVLIGGIAPALSQRQRIADNIQPALVDETTRLNDERISVPSCDQVSMAHRFRMHLGTAAADSSTH
jgi:hypothetical protein